MPYRKLGTLAVEGGNPVSLFVLEISERADYNLVIQLMASFGIDYGQACAIIDRFQIDENKTLIYVIFNGPNYTDNPVAYSITNPREGYSKVEWIQANPAFKGQGFGQLLLTHTIYESLKIPQNHQVKLENAADDLKKGAHIYGNKMSYNFLVNVIGKNYSYERLPNSPL